MKVFQSVLLRPVFIAMPAVVIISLSLASIRDVNASTVLSLDGAIRIAQSQDNWLAKSHLAQEQLSILSEGASALPDPTLNIGMLNLPTDGFALNQEPMTQLRIGASQLFPRGNTLALQQSQLQETADKQPIMRAERLSNIELQTTHLWLDAYFSQASYALVKDAEPLFDKLVEIVNAEYVSSVGKASQQDLIRAELELVRLQDRLITLSTQQQTALARLSQFLLTPRQSHSEVSEFEYFDSVGELPNHQLKHISTQLAQLNASHFLDQQTLFSLIENHPLVMVIEQQINADKIGVEIAEQNYKPQYGVSASYALRDNEPEAQGGDSRANFLSIGMTMSLPLFSTKRQDSQVMNSIHQVEITKTERLLLLRELMAGLQSSLQQYQGSSQRLNMYQEVILPQMSQQSEAALKAYTNDLGDFAEVVRAKIAELDAKITTFKIEVDRRKALAEIQYFLATYESDTDSSSNARTNSTLNLTSKSPRFQGMTND
ncbi:TolC family protein [Alteromonas sp. KUL49]|uniref:TolC family protein n=1 Tax=Alteromonas sp. KUL49 TaxID=2480798 RepID=UPI00102EDF15|nr:TolC family protein [Alteromonas sp. KUL49]TAP40837.1 TolC family protein [Alteromonas sp. KUL49]GEA11014.1 hypothetical protein KUL49_13890 [Alteromonas sp. KUL49]